jgi:cytochrome P450
MQTTAPASVRSAPPRPRRSIPRAAGLPFLGSLPAVLSEQLDFFVNARAKYGDVFAVKLGPTEIIALTHPEHAQHVLRDNAKNYWKGGPLWAGLRTLFGNGLPVSDGDFWRRQRRMMQPHFHRERLAELVDLMVEAIDEGMETWDAVAASGEPFNISPALARMTMKVIVKTMFGATITAEQADYVAREMTYAMDYLVRGIVTQSLPPWLPMPGRERYQAALRTIDAIVLRIIDERRREKKDRADLLGMFLAMVDADTGERMTDAQLRDEAVTIFFAGYDTTAQSLNWSTHFLTQKPQMLRALEGEVDAALGSARPAFSDVQRLGYAQRVLREAMRLRPPSYWIPRTAIEEDTIDGFPIPAGASVGVMTYAIHQHPSAWERPKEFDPSRFLPERSANRHGLAWMPFGAGQRMCIGNDFSLLEGQLILARIAQRYALSAVPGRTAAIHVSTMLRPKDGVWVRLQKRAASRAAH